MAYGLRAAECKPSHSQQQLNITQKKGLERRDSLPHQADETFCFWLFSSLTYPILLESGVAFSLVRREMKLELEQMLQGS